MGRRTYMQRFAGWHIWLGWIAALPLVLWTASGLFMTLRPIDEVRGNTLRIERQPAPVRMKLAAGMADTVIREGRLLNQRGRSIVLVTYMDGTVARLDLQQPNAGHLPPVDEAEARAAVRYAVSGGDQVRSVHLFGSGQAPLDFRKDKAAWQVALDDGTHVYVGRDTGEIEAIRTQFWRTFDFMWGLHIMDPMERENSSHFLLWLFGTAGLATSLLGTTLLFRRRRAAR